MTAQKDNSYKSLWKLGLTFIVLMLLVIGPVAGYLISSVLIDSFDLTQSLKPIFIGAGFLASALQGYGLIKRFNDSQK